MQSSGHRHEFLVQHRPKPLALKNQESFLVNKGRNERNCVSLPLTVKNQTFQINSILRSQGSFCLSLPTNLHKAKGKSSFVFSCTILRWTRDFLVFGLDIFLLQECRFLLYLFFVFCFFFSNYFKIQFFSSFFSLNRRTAKT